jgi:hypothetical protein
MEMRVERQILSFNAARTQDVLVKFHHRVPRTTKTAGAHPGSVSQSGVI